MNRVSVTVYPISNTLPVRDFSWDCFAAKESRRFSELQGITFGGSYAEASAWMSRQLPQARAFVLLFSHGDGMEEFLDALATDVTAVPMSGGASARDSGFGFTFPMATDVAVLAVTEGEWQGISIAAHFPVGDPIHCVGKHPRSFATIRHRGVSMRAHEFLNNARAAHGLAKDDWDRLALVTDGGTILHLHEEGGMIACGADLPESRKVRLAIFDSSRGREAILAHSSPNALAFGCAGLFGLFGEDRPWEAIMPTTYLFGEIATAKGIPRFTNLTFSLLVRRSSNAL